MEPSRQYSKMASSKKKEKKSQSKNGKQARLRQQQVFSVWSLDLTHPPVLTPPLHVRVLMGVFVGLKLEKGWWWGEEILGEVGNKEG